jgi:FKBP12-rapamycin complex-associated protein
MWTWLTNQIIARVQTPRAAIQQLIKQLLTDIGKAHPQALIYPLTVASKSQVASRREVALSVMLKMRDHSALIVDQVSIDCVAPHD